VVLVGWIGLWVFTQRAVTPAAEQASATLRSGVLQFETGTRLLSRQVRDVAALAARDPALLAALAAVEAARAPRPPGPTPQARPASSPPAPAPDLAEVAGAAVHGAATLLDVEMGRAPLVGLSHDRTISLRVGDQPVSPRDPLAQALLGSGAAPRHVRIGEAIYAVAAIPGARGATLVFGLPIDPRWSERLQAATGADLTFVGNALVSTLPPADATAVVAAARKGAGGVVDAGQLGPVSLGAGLPALPLLFAKAPAWRARAMSLSGIDGPVAVVSAPTRAALDPVAAFQQMVLLGLLALAVVGVALGFARERPVSFHVPRELAAVADRIARGDFDVRVPRMSGTFGTLAAALARGAEAGRLGRIAQGATAGPAYTPPSHAAVHPAPTLDVPLHAVPPEEATGSRRIGEPFSAPGMAPPVTPTPTPLDISPGSGLSAAAVVQAAQAARAHHPRTTQPLGPDAGVLVSGRRPGPAPVTPRPSTPAPVTRPTPAPAGAADGDEAQWSAVYQEFLRVRQGGGESVEGLTWDRFREKLRKNRDALAQKYACRTVRFQVYVKDGKAALKATPVR
jgi:HAMP domain-containing protein